MVKPPNLMPKFGQSIFSLYIYSSVKLLQVMHAIVNDIVTGSGNLHIQKFILGILPLLKMDLPP